MSDITVIGLGKMGSALAHAIHGAGIDLTVWNRSPEKLQPFVKSGVPAARDIASAIDASPVVLICVDSYAVTNAMLSSDKVQSLLNGRTIVQLSTGTPKEAREASALMAARGANYLDGAILASPAGIGTNAAEILLSGDQLAYDQAGDMLSCLGGTVRYLGPNIGAAAALDLAWLCISYGQFIAIAHAANLCRAEDVGVNEFAALFADQPNLQRYIRVIHDASFDKSTATLQIWATALQRIQEQGADANINTEFPDFVAGFLDQAIAAGHGSKNVMSIVKVMQNDGKRRS